MIRQLVKFAVAIGIVMLIMGLLTETSQAQIEPACGNRNTVVQTLYNVYGELRLGAGLFSGTIIEIWFSKDTGTWTILRSYPNGVACIMAVGENWILNVPPVPGSPT